MAVIIIPLVGRRVSQIVEAFAPGAQRKGNLVVFDSKEIDVNGVPHVKFCVAHVNDNGTDASDLSDFAEEAAERCGFSLPSSYNPLAFVKPLAKSSNPHAGSPREANAKRRVIRPRVPSGVSAA